MNYEIERTILLITGCINPNVNQTWLVLKDVEKRLEQYINSIIYYIKKSPFKYIVFCDNSNYQYDKIKDLQYLANQYGKLLEWLTFKGDDQKVAFYDNKGIGEDEIMNYICNNSHLYLRTNSFVKITGRLLLTNINELMSSFTEGTNYFYRDLYSKGLDTRFYIMDKQFYEQNIRRCYDRVKNQRLIYEVVFYKLMHGRYSLLNAYPHFIGFSSGNGRDYGKIGQHQIRLLDFLCKYKFFNKYFYWILLYMRTINKICRITRRTPIFDLSISK